MAWGAVIAAGASIVGGMMSSQSAKRAARKQEEARLTYTNLYQKSLNDIEGVQEDINDFTEAQNLIEMAQFKRAQTRQAESSYADSEAAAYQGGLSASSSMQGFMGGFTLDTLTALGDVNYNYNLLQQQSAFSQDLSNLQRDADWYAAEANRYGGALISTNNRYDQAQSQIWGAAGQAAGAIAGNYWG